ncbi:unnamed protein product, partial [Prorocentrum cordatum]
MRAPPIICDICRRQLDPCGSVWTCENGRRTVLHAVAYDVCQYCFALHAHGVEIPADNGRGGAHSDSYSGSSNASEEGQRLGVSCQDAVAEPAHARSRSCRPCPRPPPRPSP